jgi:hypothetical protein
LGPLLDAQARREYARRLELLAEELEEAESLADLGRAERLRTEREQIAGELSRAVGLGGRDRPAGAAAERARVAVTRSLRDAIERIGRQAPTLGRHLQRAVRTGIYCRYESD